MFLGLSLLGWVFWMTLMVIAISIGVIVISTRRRSWWIVGTNVVLVLVQTLMATALWMLLGECVLPQPAVIEFQQGMSLCPGQGAIIRMEIPVGGKNI